MVTLFASLTHAITAGPFVAAGAAFVWGVLSVVLSPCHLASIPLVVAFVHGQGAVSGRRTLALSLTFALGILVTIAAIGAPRPRPGACSATSAASAISSWRRSSSWSACTCWTYCGCPAPDAARGRPPAAGYPAHCCSGLVFGVALGPCTFAYLAPMLGVAFKVAASRPLVAGSLLLAYAFGHCAVIVAAGMSTRHVQRFLDWRVRSLGSTILRRVCGGLILAAGVYLVATAH